MNRLSTRLAALSFIAALAGCATKAAAPEQFDLGPPTPRALSAQPLPAVSLPEIEGPGTLDSRYMLYRLLYTGEQQARPYANSRWAAPPAALLDQRVRSRIAQAGGAVVQGADSITSLPTLRVEADDFSQVFSSPASSEARVSLRASLYDGYKLLQQKTFSRTAPAPSANAAGGAAALSAATDAAIDDLILWLVSVPVKK